MIQRTLSRLPVLLLMLGAAGCAPPDTSDLFNDIQLEVLDAPGTSAAYVSQVSQATDSLLMALPAGDDTDLTDAILERWQAGVLVELVIDIDNADDPGFADLIDAGVPVVQGDDSVRYFDFALNDEVHWDSDEVTMSEAFVVVDHQLMVTSTSAGSMDAGDRVVLTARGENLIEDILTEHNQLYGGLDCTAMTAYNAPQKSIADYRWDYPGNTDALLEMWLGPQERLTKRVIDAIYGARASVWVLTNDFANDGMSKALQDKAEWSTEAGEAFFDIKVVVGPNFGDASPGQSGQLTNQTPDVPKRQVDYDRVPTLVIVDQGVARDGSDPAPRAFLITHDLYSSARLYNQQEVVNDQLIDGTMWVYDDWDTRSPEMTALISLWDKHWEAGEAL